MLYEILLVLNLVELTSPDGNHIEINPIEVVAIREPRGTDIRIVAKNTHCIIFTSDGKFLQVTETCEQVAEKFRTGVP